MLFTVKISAYAFLAWIAVEALFSVRQEENIEKDFLTLFASFLWNDMDV